VKILNIDALAAPKRALRLKNVEYPIREITVQEFIDSMTAMEELEAQRAAEEKAAAESGEVAQAGEPAKPKQSLLVKLYVDMVMELVPTAPREELTRLPLMAIITVLKFCRGDDDEIVASVTAEDSAPNVA
jgi:hypothetical protein